MSERFYLNKEEKKGAKEVAKLNAFRTINDEIRVTLAWVALHHESARVRLEADLLFEKVKESR